jgi:DNA-binding HxlR family transcriptional regulator
MQKYKSHCEATLKMIRGKGKLLILHALTDRTLRYSEIARRNTSISESLLVRQLRELEQDGLVTRTVYPEVPPRVEYALTASGKKLVPIIRLMSLWNTTYIDRDIAENRLLTIPVSRRNEALVALRDDLDTMLLDLDRKLKCGAEKKPQIPNQ